ncbi:MAG TPA: hypothetical protein VKY85_16570 [Candidatus Angelobacter sp.]|nr:hypothetical protein [Candidatus Angelobacter sp.]
MFAKPKRVVFCFPESPQRAAFAETHFQVNSFLLSRLRLNPYRERAQQKAALNMIALKGGVMELLLIHWQIKQERAEEFETYWKRLMNVEGKKQLIQEAGEQSR